MQEFNFISNYFECDYSKLELKSDSKSIESDWEIVNSHIQSIIGKKRKFRLKTKPRYLRGSVL